jgi:hypothetical protein
MTSVVRERIRYVWLEAVVVQEKNVVDVNWARFDKGEEGAQSATLAA